MEAIVWYSGPVRAKGSNEDCNKFVAQHLMLRIYPVDLQFVDFEDFYNYVYNIRDNSSEVYVNNAWEISTIDIKDGVINVRYNKDYDDDYLDIYDRIKPILTELTEEYNEYKRSI